MPILGASTIRCLDRPSLQTSPPRRSTASRLSPPTRACSRRRCDSPPRARRSQPRPAHPQEPSHLAPAPRHDRAGRLRARTRRWRSRYAAQPEDPDVYRSSRRRRRCRLRCSRRNSRRSRHVESAEAAVMRLGRVATLRRPPRRTAPSATEQSCFPPSPDCCSRTRGATPSAIDDFAGRSTKRLRRRPPRPACSARSALVASKRSGCRSAMNASAPIVPRESAEMDENQLSGDGGRSRQRPRLLVVQGATLVNDDLGARVRDRAEARAFAGRPPSAQAPDATGDVLGREARRVAGGARWSPQFGQPGQRDQLPLGPLIADAKQEPRLRLDGLRQRLRPSAISFL
jgi:hypothetical protein